MSVTISVPTTLRPECSGRSVLTTRSGTVRKILDWLKFHHPQLYRSICDETGSVRQHVNLFVNDDFLHEREGINTLLSEGDTLTIMPAVSGG